MLTDVDGVVNNRRHHTPPFVHQAERGQEGRGAGTSAQQKAREQGQSRGRGRKCTTYLEDHHGRVLDAAANVAGDAVAKGDLLHACYGGHGPHCVQAYREQARGIRGPSKERRIRWRRRCRRQAAAHRAKQRAARSACIFRSDSLKGSQRITAAQTRCRCPECPEPSCQPGSVNHPPESGQHGDEANLPIG